MKIRSLPAAITFVAILLFTTHTIATPTYDYNMGTVTGVSGLEFSGETWDMTLVNFPPLDPANVPYIEVYPQSFAQNATFTLYNWMNAESTIPDPDSFFSCTSLYPDCRILTPFLTFEGWISGAVIGIFSDNTLSYQNQSGTDPFNWGYITYATWQLQQPNSVPEAPIAWLFISGLIGLIAAARRKKA